MITFNSLVGRAKILNEANLYNNADLTSDVMSVVEDASPEIQKWFKQKYIPWYNSPAGDSEKNTAPYSWKEGDQDWAKDKADLVTFKGLTSSERSNIRDITEYLATLPEESVKKVTYAQAIDIVEATPSATSFIWKARVLKYYADIDALLKRTDTFHLTNAKEWFYTKFMLYFLKECPEFNTTSGIYTNWYDSTEITWYDKIQHTMEYIGSQNRIDLGYERGLNDIDPATLVAEAERTTKRGAIESNIKPLAEGVDYVKIDPLYNYTASEDNEDAYQQFNKAMKIGGYKFVRLISKQSFINEGEYLNHCVKSDTYKVPKNHTLLSLWRGDNPKGDPQATMEFDNEGKDVNPDTKKVDTSVLKTMTQCKGKGNHAPTSDRVKYILRKFITLNDIEITQDGEKIGLRQWLRKFYDPDSRKWSQLFKDVIIPAQEKAFKEIKMRIIDADTGKKVYPNG